MGFESNSVNIGYNSGSMRLTRPGGRRNVLLDFLGSDMFLISLQALY